MEPKKARAKQRNGLSDSRAKQAPTVVSKYSNTAIAFLFSIPVQVREPMVNLVMVSAHMHPYIQSVGTNVLGGLVLRTGQEIGQKPATAHVHITEVRLIVTDCVCLEDKWATRMCISAMVVNAGSTKPIWDGMPHTEEPATENASSVPCRVSLATNALRLRNGATGPGTVMMELTRRPALPVLP